MDGPSGANDWEGGALWCVKPHRDTSHLPAEMEEAADSVDKHDYGRAPRMFPVNDRRVSFLGEFGGIGCRVGDHLWTTNAWGYGGTGGDTDRAAVQQKFVTLMEHVAGLARRGLGGSVYTQTTDVEGEINGLMTYDRKVKKFDAAALAAAHAKVREAAALGLVPYEEKTVFPYVERLQAGESDDDFDIETFSKHHGQTNQKLRELKNIILKYLPSDMHHNNRLTAALYDIYNCETWLSQHAEVEENIFLPAIRRLEKQLRKNDVAVKISNMINPGGENSETLSEREKDVVIGVVQGMTNKEIADHLCISINTVITHRRNIARKLQIHSPAGLTIYAIVNNWVDIASVQL